MVVLAFFFYGFMGLLHRSLGLRSVGLRCLGVFGFFYGFVSLDFFIGKFLFAEKILLVFLVFFSGWDAACVSVLQ